MEGPAKEQRPVEMTVMQLVIDPERGHGFEEDHHWVSSVLGEL